ncbi:hypothetical protein MIR68_011963 [Amoeboaphelidium protococcarum]|nr:hypothetical protein MIR68_011963 [Amoeboaphelidium protococcarum]
MNLYTLVVILLTFIISLYGKVGVQGVTETLRLNLVFSNEVSEPVQRHLIELLQQSVGKDALLFNCNGSNASNIADYTIQFGPVVTDKLTRLNHSREEKFEIVSENQHGLGKVIACHGSAQNFTGKYTRRLNANIGLLYCAYEILHQIGFVFLHSEQPVIPPANAIWYGLSKLKSMPSQSPLYPIRRWHIHTQHPLPLTTFLNGLSLRSPVDGQISTPWEDMIPLFHLKLQWLIANKQESLEWVLLWHKSYIESMDLRLQRLKRIMQSCEMWAINCGFDIPLSLWQQHSLLLTQNLHTGSTWYAQSNLESNTRLFLSIGQFISTEIGSSEFTATSCSNTLQHLNVLGDIAQREYGVQVFVKIHVSQGLRCQINGSTVNFNFLPSLANEGIALMPHTVQLSALDEPVLSYGNFDSKFMLDYMFNNSVNAEKSIIYYPETSYWVNFDIDVPLFLSPLYAYNRMRDVRMIHEQVVLTDRPLLGQMVFESGEDWAYDIANVIAARLSYDHRFLELNERDAFMHLIEPVAIAVIGASMDAVDPQLINMVNYALYDITMALKEHLQFVDSSGTMSLAYLIGRDTWSELGSMFQNLMANLPRRPSFRSIRRMASQPMHDNFYQSTIRGQLIKIARGMMRIDKVWAAVGESIGRRTTVHYNLIKRCIEMTTFRAIQMYHLYEASYFMSQAHNQMVEDWHLKQARFYTETAIKTTQDSQRFLIGDISMKAQWNAYNPTVYKYQYLWTAFSGYYFIRDYQIIQSHAQSRIILPCFMNIIDPLDVAFGIKSSPLLSFITECLYVQDAEPAKWKKYALQ